MYISFSIQYVSSSLCPDGYVFGDRIWSVVTKEMAKVIDTSLASSSFKVVSYMCLVCQYNTLSLKNDVDRKYLAVQMVSESLFVACFQETRPRRQRVRLENGVIVASSEAQTKGHACEVWINPKVHIGSDKGKVVFVSLDAVSIVMHFPDLSLSLLLFFTFAFISFHSCDGNGKDTGETWIMFDKVFARCLVVIDAILVGIDSNLHFARDHNEPFAGYAGGRHKPSSNLETALSHISLNSLILRSTFPDLVSESFESDP